MIYMSRKRIEVVELNKKDEKIILEEKQSALILFWRRHGLLIFLTLLMEKRIFQLRHGIKFIKKKWMLLDNG